MIMLWARFQTSLKELTFYSKSVDQDRDFGLITCCETVPLTNVFQGTRIPRLFVDETILSLDCA